MMLNSTSQFLAKILSIALLGAVSKTWAFLYLLGDLCLFLLYTIVRNDFFYFIPFQSTLGSVAISLLMRTIEKVREEVTDVIAELQKSRVLEHLTSPPPQYPTHRNEPQQ